MRLTSLFLLTTLPMFVNPANAFQITDQHYFTADYDGKVKGQTTGEPMVDPGDFVNNLRGSVTVNFFTDPSIDGQNGGEKPTGAISPSGQLNAAWKSGGDAAFQFKNGFFKIDAAGDTEATFTLNNIVKTTGGVDSAGIRVTTNPGETVWVVIPASSIADRGASTENHWFPSGTHEQVGGIGAGGGRSGPTIFSLTSMVARQAADGIAENGVNHDTIRGTVGQHGLAQANQAPNVVSDVSDYRQHTQNIFLNNHPSESPELLQYMTFPVTFSNAVQELVSVELQIDLQDSGSPDSREIEIYGLTVTKDLASLGLTIIPEPATLLLALLGLALVPPRLWRG